MVNFNDNLRAESTRDEVFKRLINDCPAFLRHYIDLDRKYSSQNDTFFEYVNALKRRITDRATTYISK